MTYARMRSKLAAFCSERLHTALRGSQYTCFLCGFPSETHLAIYLVEKWIFGSPLYIIVRFPHIGSDRYEKVRQAGGKSKRVQLERAKALWFSDSKKAVLEMLALIRLKLRAVKNGTSSVRQEFLACQLLSDGHTVSHHLPNLSPQQWSKVPILPT